MFSGHREMFVNGSKYLHSSVTLSLNTCCKGYAEKVILHVCAGVFMCVCHGRENDDRTRFDCMFQEHKIIHKDTTHTASSCYMHITHTNVFLNLFSINTATPILYYTIMFYSVDQLI